jgi:hypothetical protein
MRSFPIPDWVQGTGLEESDDGTPEDDVEEQPNSSSEAESKLSAAFVTWTQDLKHVLKEHKSSAHFFSRVWSRFYFTAVGVCSDVPQRERYLGFMVHRLVIAFLHAFMVEEITYRNVKSTAGKFGLSNPITDDKVFLNNLRLLLRTSDMTAASDAGTTQIQPTEAAPPKIKLIKILPIFAEVLCCPLWAAFISPEVVLTKKSGNDNMDNCSNLLEFQCSLWETGISADNAASANYPEVSYSPPKGEAVKFPNLYHPLNSVLMVSRHRNTSK